MRYAIISDLHANLQAWLAVEKDIRNHGADSVICLGDIVGYGPNPVAVLDSARHRCDGIVLGDHDAVVAGLMSQDTFDDDARRLLDWTTETLDDEAGAFLSTAPYKIGDGNMLCVHAEADRPDRFQFVFDARDAKANFDASDQPVVFMGHTHVPGIFSRDAAGEIACQPAESMGLKTDHRYIVNVGSVGDPLDGNPYASYCLYDSDTHDLVFRRVSFNFDGYSAAIAKSGIHTEPCCLSIVHADIEKTARRRGPQKSLSNLRPSMHTRGSGILQPVPAAPPPRAKTENKDGTVKARAQKPSAEILGKTNAPTKTKPRKSPKKKRRKKTAQKRAPRHAPQKVVPIPPPQKTTEEGNFVPWVVVVMLSLALLIIGGGLIIMATKKPQPAYEFIIDQLNQFKAKPIEAH